MQPAHRVAVNTGILYARMAITVFISLYSTRLVLAALGADDFGIFNLVGGVIAMLGFMNASMAATTQRFISVAQGAGDIDKVKRIFNMSTCMHAGIAILVVLILEGVSQYFFQHVLRIPSGRVETAKIVYHCMVVATFFTIISVQYEAVLTSHENMLFYAIIGVLEAVAKLTIAIYITSTEYDHLVAYGVLMAALSVLLLAVRRVYCHWRYAECQLGLSRYFDRSLLKEMTVFASWSFLASSSSMLANYGQGIVLNVFFGTIVNAAQGIANQISGQLGVFATTLIKALNPVIAKSEGSGNRKLMITASLMGCKISFFLLVLMYVTFLLEMPFILRIWLHKVPEYTVIFCRLLLIRNLIDQMVIPLDSSISAVGQIKNFKIITSILSFTPLLFSYMLFRHGLQSYMLYYMFLLYSFANAIVTVLFARKYCSLPIPLFLKDVVARSAAVLCVAMVLSSFPVWCMQTGLLQLVSVIFISVATLLIMIWTVGFNIDERNGVKEMSATLLAKIPVFKNE